MKCCYSLVCTVAPNIMSPEQEMNGTLGDDLMMDCLHTGTPRPDLKWLHNDVAVNLLDRYSVMDNGSLLISSMKAEDAGVWTCVVSNVLGQAQMNVTVSYDGDKGRL